MRNAHDRGRSLRAIATMAIFSGDRVARFNFRRRTQRHVDGTPIAWFADVMIRARHTLVVVGSLFALGCTGAIEGPTDWSEQEGTDNSLDDSGVIHEPPRPHDGGGTTPPYDSSTPTSDAPGPGAPDATPVDPGPGPGPSPDLPLVKGLDIDEVAIFQGVKIDVAKSGAKVAKRNADVIVGRAGIVRVYVTPSSGWSAREVTGKLELVSSSGSTVITSAPTTISSASSDAALTSTINFELPTDAIKADTKYVVSLGTAPGQPGSGGTDKARYPSSGTAESLDARSTGDVMKVTIVPVTIAGRSADVGPAQIELYRQAAYAIYPTRKVEISVRAPYAWSGSIDGSGAGFDELLNQMVSLRAKDAVAKNVYYYGAFANAGSFDEYCSGGCVTGLCGLTDDPTDETVRACVGVGFTGAYSASTMAHEVGHAHGRYHAPCGGAAGTDPKYPYSGAKIGSWGYDLNTKSLVDPKKYVDLMSYCEPTFVSDFNYQGLVERMAAVAGSPSIYAPDAPTHYRLVNVKGDGSLRWGDPIEVHTPLVSKPISIALEDDAGKTISTVTGHFYPYDHLPGGMLFVPEPSITFRRLTAHDVIPGLISHLTR